MTAPRSQCLAAVLPHNKLIVVGGWTPDGWTPDGWTPDSRTNSVEIAIIV